jgi:hypothetical protein
MAWSRIREYGERRAGVGKDSKGNCGKAEETRDSSSLSVSCLYICLRTYCRIAGNTLICKTDNSSARYYLVEQGKLNDVVTNNSVALDRQQTVPTERTQLVGKASANFCGKRVPRGRRDGSLWP